MGRRIRVSATRGREVRIYPSIMEAVRAFGRRSPEPFRFWATHGLTRLGYLWKIEDQGNAEVE